jgi:hypothetical protein
LRGITLTPRHGAPVRVISRRPARPASRELARATVEA